MENQKVEFLRTVKGAPLSILVAFILIQEPLGHDYLVRATGWSKDNVTNGLRVLNDLGYIEPLPGQRYCGWVLTDRIHQMSLFDSTPIISDSRTTTTYLNKVRELKSSNSPVECENLGLEALEIVKVLTEAGVRGKKVLQLANLPHISLEYVTNHLEFGRKRKDDLALIIYRMQEGDPMPKIHNPDERRLDQDGPYGEYINTYRFKDKKESKPWEEEE